MSCLHQILSFLRSLQDFLRVKSLEDADAEICSLAWNANLLAVTGYDKQLRVYDVGQDAGLWPMRMSFVLRRVSLGQVLVQRLNRKETDPI